MLLFMLKFQDVFIGTVGVIFQLLADPGEDRGCSKNTIVIS